MRDERVRSGRPLLGGRGGKLLGRFRLVHPGPVQQVAGVEPFAQVVAAGVGVVEDLLDVPLHDDLALVDQEAAVGDLKGLADVVVGEQDAQVVLLGQSADLELDLRHGLGVDAGERLVEHDELRLGDQAAGDFQTPALAAGDPIGLRLADLLEAELGQQLFLAGLAVAPAHPFAGLRMAIRLSSTVSCLKTLESWAR